MGNQDEILAELVELLKKKKKTASTSSSQGDGEVNVDGRDRKVSVDPVALALRVLELDEGNFYDVPLPPSLPLSPLPLCTQANLVPSNILSASTRIYSPLLS